MATIEFKINYLKAIKPGTEVIGEGWVVKAGKRVIFCEGKITDGSGQVVATGSGAIMPYSK